ncbi:MAG: amidohydrolase family protein [Chloroflexi bacterium]|nr:amidohydrolase family protein [Chloroflexota bacterium]
MKIIFPLILPLLLILAACTASTPTGSEPILALVHGTLIDGRGGSPLQDAVLLIQGERILAIGPYRQVKIPRSARVIDLKGKTILPGFINAHVHFAFDERNLAAWAQGGVTTVRDEGYQGPKTLEQLVAWRNAANQNPGNARLVSAGRMITVPGGYGSLHVDSPESARQAVFSELDAGLDVIKISMEDGYAGTSGLPKLSPEELSAIVTAAHERGVRVSGHITQAAYLKDIVEAGVDDAAHLAYDPIPMEILQSMVAKDIYLVPTFSVFRAYGAPTGPLLENLSNFIKAGGKVAMGNDYGGGPGDFELGIPMYEIEMMAEAGMSPMQVILASTRNAAHVVGLEDEIGTLEAGKIADILVVSANPLDDLQALRQVFMVAHLGQIIFPQGEKPLATPTSTSNSSD